MRKRIVCISPFNQAPVYISKMCIIDPYILYIYNETRQIDCTNHFNFCESYFCWWLQQKCWQLKLLIWLACLVLCPLLASVLLKSICLQTNMPFLISFSQISSIASAFKQTGWEGKSKSKSSFQFLALKSFITFGFSNFKAIKIETLKQVHHFNAPLKCT